MTTKKFKTKYITVPVLAILGLSAAISSFYTVEEGHVGIVKRFSEAKYQENPGLHFKAPFIDVIEEIEVRTRKNQEKMPSSTSEQMPVTVHASVNWTVDKAAAIDLFRKYGGLNQFEQRILDPRFRAAVKTIIPKFTAEKLIQDRATAIMGIESELMEEMKGFPVSVDNIQIENIVLPAKYLQSIETKQTEKNLADAEKFKLDRQKLEAMREVNTADAQAQAIIKVAEAEAKATEIKGLAEAKAIEAKAKSLRNNPLIIALTQAQNWDGKLPTTVMSEKAALPILKLPEPKE
ncbi:prohibitin family protein [Temperatibacter marinus]|uniref:Prohibitin family protein n=1 Tax=Temperatibacter marinus TaxID=1456591 RepID=A0AA52HAD4_9PROT|nr:prohibitin family protein [Temperatibacter marinus]WND02483.1 prohibitin family protein [Temperatibacter marinus]